VELNTIASSFGCLSSLTTQLHSHILGRLAAAAAAAASGSSSNSSGGGGGSEQAPKQQQQQQLLQLLEQRRLPSNEAMQGIARALAAATAAAGSPGAAMVMVVQPGERNAYDQQASGWLATTAFPVLLCAGGSRSECWW
jgi:glutathione synthase